MSIEPDWLAKMRNQGAVLGETHIDPLLDPPRDADGEAVFQARVIALAQSYGWRVAHFRAVRVAGKDGKTHFETPVAADGKGFPDLILVRSGELVVAELKVGKNKATAEQAGWLEAFRETGCASGVWRPKDWSMIVKALVGEPGGAP